MAGGAPFGAETVVVAGARRRHAQKLLILVDRLNNAGEEYEEAQVLHGVLADRASCDRRREMVALLCLPDPLMDSKGFSCCRHTRP